jgi:quercetin dioxygenase-like cupin family protein
MRFHRFEDIVEYLPAGHEKVVNRLLVGEGNGGDGTVSVWHGRLDPGGKSDLHTHPGSLQIYVGVSGVMVVGNDDEEHELHPLATAIFPKGTKHFIENRSEGPTEVLVISVPGLR